MLRMQLSPYRQVTRAGDLWREPGTSDEAFNLEVTCYVCYFRQGAGSRNLAAQLKSMPLWLAYYKHINSGMKDFRDFADFRDCWYSLVNLHMSTMLYIIHMIHICIILVQIHCYMTLDVART